MQVAPLTPTTHTPPDGGSRSPRTGARTTARHTSIRIQQVRELLDQIEAQVPELCEAHLGRVEDVLAPAHTQLRDLRSLLGKWDRRRQIRRRDDRVELLSARQEGERN